MSTHLTLRKVTKEDLPLLLEWRNSWHVRQYMYSSHIIQAEEHERWFASINQDNNRHPLLFIDENKPTGFVNIGPVKEGGIASWGFYTAPNAPKGTGRALGDAALAYAFNQLQLHKLCGEVLGNNEASQKFHLRLGFKQEGRLVGAFYDGEKYHDVVQFGLIKTEWQAKVR